jgi:hypothetical protein
MKDFSVDGEKVLLDFISGYCDRDDTSVYFGVDV